MPINQDIFQQLQLSTLIPAEVNGQQNGVNNDPVWEKNYAPCAEAELQDGTTEGEVVALKDWADSSVYPGTRRNIWLYATPGLSANDSPMVMFFNDGAWYLSRQGPVQVTNVLNTMFKLGEIGPTIAIFVTPGIPDHDVTGPIASYDNANAQRSLEYDVPSPRYGEFLFEELLPLAASTFSVSPATSPQQRITCGISSGGIAAWTAAWFHPDQCTRVLSHCGSYTDIWGGHNYPGLIRKTPRKPIRVFLQSGRNDANTPFGDWALANKTMASAFEYAGYDYRFEFGEGGHSLNHGGALFADSLRWLLR